MTCGGGRFAAPGLLLGLAVVFVSGGCDSAGSQGDEGLACGATRCALGQICCLDCDGTGRCGAPGTACSGSACTKTTEPDAGVASTDAGTKADGASAGVSCGQGHCVAPQACCLDCDNSGSCVAAGEPCPGLACTRSDACGAMDVEPVGFGGCERPPRYFWDGSSCAVFDACGCKGADCSQLLPSLLSCQRQFDDCGAESLQISCGDRSCDAATHYCSSFVGGMVDSLVTYDCVALPQACREQAIPDCACVGAVGGGCSCGRTAQGGIRVECAAP